MRYRFRIRFRKEGDLRWISHRDLARLWERTFRRAGLGLAMSEGYHPKVRLSFPSALGLGVVGLDEVLEAELLEPLAEAEVQRRLLAAAPPGLVVARIEPVPPGTRKAQLRRATYELPVPEERRAALDQAVHALWASAEWRHLRADKHAEVDVRRDLERLELHEGRLVLTLRFVREASARPRDVLEILGVGDLEAAGVPLTRTCVELV
jgi:radical SAM-linked protein